MRRVSMSRPSPALAISVIALFISLGGTGYAVSGFGHSSATTAKKKKHKKKVKLIPGPQGAQGLRGLQGVQGIQGPVGGQGAKGDTGPAGTARGYGAVALPCTVGSACTVTNAQNATVTHPFGGVFCITVAGVDPSTTGVVATLTSAVAGDYIQAFSSGGSCPALEVVTRDGAGNADKPFFFLVP
jgi:hypothetical protein